MHVRSHLDKIVRIITLSVHDPIDQEVLTPPTSIAASTSHADRAGAMPTRQSPQVRRTFAGRYVGVTPSRQTSTTSMKTIRPRRGRRSGTWSMPLAPQRSRRGPPCPRRRRQSPSRRASLSLVRHTSTAVGSCSARQPHIGTYAARYQYHSVRPCTRCDIANCPKPGRARPSMTRSPPTTRCGRDPSNRSTRRGRRLLRRLSWPRRSANSHMRTAPARSVPRPLPAAQPRPRNPRPRRATRRRLSTH